MEDRLALLAELKRVHRDLLEASDAFEAMLRKPAPDAMLLANVRLKLIVPNGRRRMLLEKIYAALGELSPGDAERIRQLRAEGVAAVMRSSQHIAVWTPRQVMDNWQGYLAGSIGIPSSVRASVQLEQRVLYPLLSADARSAA